MYISFYLGYFASSIWWLVDPRLESICLILIKREYD